MTKLKFSCVCVWGGGRVIFCSDEWCLGTIEALEYGMNYHSRVMAPFYPAWVWKQEKGSTGFRRGEGIIRRITMWKLLSDFLTQRPFANSNRVNTRALMLDQTRNWILIRVTHIDMKQMERHSWKEEKMSVPHTSHISL